MLLKRGDVYTRAKLNLRSCAIRHKVAAGFVQELKDILALVSAVPSRAHTVESQCRFVAPAPNAAYADLQEISYLPHGQHPVELVIIRCMLHGSLLIC